MENHPPINLFSPPSPHLNPSIHTPVITAYDTGRNPPRNGLIVAGAVCYTIDSQAPGVFLI
jgi:hypothetical protein